MNPRIKDLSLLLLTSLPLYLVGCGGEGEEPSIETCNYPDAKFISFSNHVIPLLNDHCTLCHQPTGGTGILNQKPYLTIEYAYDNLVDNPIQAPGTLPFVNIGKPEDSQIYRKIIGDPRAGNQMPLGLAPLNDDQICIIEQWIIQGAKNN